MPETVELPDRQTIQLPDLIPLIPLRDVNVFPPMILPLFVGREASLAAIDAAMANDRIVFLATQKDPGEETPTPEGIFQTGVVAIIIRTLQLPDERTKILVQALTKARLIEMTREGPFPLARVEVMRDMDPPENTIEIEALMRSVREQAESLFVMKGVFSPEMGEILNGVEEPGRLADIVAANLRLRPAEAQELLETVDTVARLRSIHELLAREIEVSSVQARIQSEAKEEMSRTQREFFLREQLRAIKRELGEMDERSEEIAELQKKIEKARMPGEAEHEAKKQLHRFELMHPESSEATLVRTYLDWLVELPWSSSTRDKLDTSTAERILDEDHYDLEKVKERIIEFIAVRKLHRGARGPILCLAGPPGVGKTSLGRSIARAIGRRFVRISLGGVRDEAEIRGHRRTYVGALPGKIIQGIRRAGSNNPVFVMDEVDKIGSDFRGDPAAALLEVLDPEQNNTFRDHYIDLPFDLSKVLFILTANVTDTIPSALLDRLEILRLSGYTNDEKIAIARRYLIPKQVREHGLPEGMLVLPDQTLDSIIQGYTREAGLRELERQIGAICRKIARRMTDGADGPFRVTAANLSRYLGVEKYPPEILSDEAEPGLALGLAWTPFGGDVLRIEVSVMKGKGKLVLTGLLGEVMKESAQAALSYARSRAEALGIDTDGFEERDIHVHVPAGAIPKDGPSAGITLSTALVSALTGKPVRTDVAMTGEITLRGRVLPIGGLKEKALAALRAGITTVIIPEGNLKDLEELPAHIRKRLRFEPVSHMDQVLDVAMQEGVIHENR